MTDGARGEGERGHPFRRGFGPETRRGWLPDTRRGRRLFVAVPVADDVRDLVAAIVDDVRSAEPPDDDRRRGRRSDVRWVRLDGIHLTLRFLGPTPEERIPSLASAVRETASAIAPFEVRLGGAGAFPNPDRPRALWIGITEGEPQLAALASALDARLVAIGWPPEERPYRAHLTLARTDGVPAARDAVGRLVHAAAGLDAGWRADRVVLFESHTGNGPARYEPLIEAPLGT